ncbi:MAG: hypothetical protein MJY45_00865 [Bacteroidales bacterium]|nr:hypothetical protein [Bacteroidales bacterium]
MSLSFGDSGETVELYERSLTANLPAETIHEMEIHRTHRSAGAGHLQIPLTPRMP